MQDYALVDYPQFSDLDEMQLNPHTIPGMYVDYDNVTVVTIFLGTYIGVMKL